MKVLASREDSVKTSLKERIRGSKNMDNEIALALELIKSAGPRTISKGIEEWNTEDGLILFRGRIYVLKDQDLRREIVWQHHDPPAAGHPGEWKTVERVQRDFWWPGMTVFIKEYVKGCAICQASKNQPNRAKIPVVPILADVHALPFQVVSTDFITDLSLSKGFDSILVFIDHDVSKGVVFAPCHKNITVVQTADLYKDQIFCNFQGDDWADLLPAAEFAHNSTVHSSTKKAPFDLIMGYIPRSLPKVLEDSTLPAISQRLKRLEDIKKDTITSHQLAAQVMARKRPKMSKKYQKGDKVWLEAKNLATTHLSVKLAP
ncbi:hypothetical protein EW146_g9271 [Bondarzewia mesenterica]|uniref:Integrase zinc-binding domain-containing protein n=1 Tax=Bondarzewia mesenterica TaxID=1095465 RepID=A0A4S4L968_9AGAM|nr:hypothetical protein EW146_g9271 [Bondarzewia mesenterica]